MMTQYSTMRVGLALLLVVGIEAVVVLYAVGLGHTPLTHFDYWLYERLAINMVEHGTFAMSAEPPYWPSLYRPPGYPAFIALIYALAGRNVLAVRLAQFVLLWLTAWLLYAVAARLVGRSGAIAAAGLCVIYPPFVFTATEYGPHALTLFLLALVMLITLALQGHARPHILGFFAVGILLGMVTLVRPAFQLLLVGVMAVIVFNRPWRSMKQRWLAACALALGYALLITPWVIRNNLVSDYQAGYKIMVGGWQLYTSALQYTGDVSYRLLKPEWDVVIADFNRRHREAEQAIPALHPAATSERLPSVQAQRELWVDHGFIEDSWQKFSHLTPAHFLSHLPQRLFWLWSTYDNSPWQTGLFHRCVQFFHVMLFALILVGAYLCRSNFTGQWAVWLLAVYQTLLHLVFHVEARFTLEARLFLIIYAGVALSYLVWRLRPQGVADQVASLDSAALPRGEVR